MPEGSRQEEFPIPPQQESEEPAVVNPAPERLNPREELGKVERDQDTTNQIQKIRRSQLIAQARIDIEAGGKRREDNERRKQEEKKITDAATAAGVHVELVSQSEVDQTGALAGLRQTTESNGTPPAPEAPDQTK